MLRQQEDIAHKLCATAHARLIVATEAGIRIRRGDATEGHFVRLSGYDAAGSRRSALTIANVEQNGKQFLAMV